MLRKFDPVRVIEGFKPLVHFLSASGENGVAKCSQREDNYHLLLQM